MLRKSARGHNPLLVFEVSRPLASVRNGRRERGRTTSWAKMPFCTGALALDAVTAWNEHNFSQGHMVALAIPPRLVTIYADEVHIAAAPHERDLPRLPHDLQLVAQSFNRTLTVAPEAMTSVEIFTGEDHKRRLMLHFEEESDPVAQALAQERQLGLEVLRTYGFTPTRSRKPGIVLGELSRSLIEHGLTKNIYHYAQVAVDLGVQASSENAPSLQPFRLMPATLQDRYVELIERHPVRQAEITTELHPYFPGS